MGWKENIEDMGLVEAEIQHDKNVTWSKLQTRLHKPARHYRGAWMLAAACVAAIVFLLPTFFANENRETAKPVRTNFGSSSMTVKARQRIRVNGDTTAIPQNIQEVNQGLVTKSKRKTTAKVAVTFTAVIPAAISNEQPTDMISPGITTAPPIAAVATGHLPHKQLPVIHINELGEDKHEATRLTRAEKNRLIRFGLTDQNKYGKAAVANNMTFSISPSKKNSTN